MCSFGSVAVLTVREYSVFNYREVLLNTRSGSFAIYIYLSIYLKRSLSKIKRAKISLPAVCLKLLEIINFLVVYYKSPKSTKSTANEIPRPFFVTAAKHSRNICKRIKGKIQKILGKVEELHFWFTKYLLPPILEGLSPTLSNSSMTATR